MKTAHVHYRLTSISRNRSHPIVKNKESFSSGPTYLVTNFGDDDGFAMIDKDGNPIVGVDFACSPQKFLIDPQKNEYWSHLQNSYSAAVHSTRIGAEDIRCIGLNSIPFMETYHEICSNWALLFSKGEKPEIHHSGDLIEITLDHDFSDSPDIKDRVVFTWTIDKSRDFALIRHSASSVLPDGSKKLGASCETEYKYIDKYWFPSKFKGWQLGNGGSTVSSEYELVEATFDRPEHPKSLTPDLLQIPAGAWIGFPGSHERLTWDGTSAIPREKWLEFRLISGNSESEQLEIKNQLADNYRYPAWWYDDTGKMGITDLETKPDAWEAYVRRWCFKNSVDDQQRTEAKSVLESSRKEARAILDKRAPELDKIEAKLKDKTLEPKKAEEARAEAARLLAPIGEIFNRLKARLESLLLQKQISTKQPTTAPTAIP